MTTVNFTILTDTNLDTLLATEDAPRHERFGKYSVAPNNGGWTLFDWRHDQDIEWFATRGEAVAAALRAR